MASAIPLTYFSNDANVLLSILAAAINRVVVVEGQEPVAAVAARQRIGIEVVENGFGFAELVLPRRANTLRQIVDPLGERPSGSPLRETEARIGAWAV